MKKREKRRYLTEKYRQKQIRLFCKVNCYTPYDKDRHFRTGHAKKARFLYELRGEFTDSKTANHWIDDNYFTPERLGRYRRHSFDDCGNARCPMCSNPRKNGFRKKKERLTRPEIVAEQQMIDDLLYYEETENED